MSEYQLFHGDCLDVLPTLAPQSVDAVICDIPSGRTACAWDSVIPFEPMWANIKRVLKPHGACVLFGSQPFTSALIMSNVKQFRYDWVWDKVMVSGVGKAGVMPLKVHESIVVFSEQQPRYLPQCTGVGSAPFGRRVSPKSITNGDRDDSKMRRGVGYPKSILRYPRPNNLSGGGLHPTQKPQLLLEYLVKTYTNEGGTVLDFTFGSGTTGAACGNLGRRFIGIEKDAAYFATGSERIATAYAPLRHMEMAV